MILYAVVWNYRELPKKEALLVRSESALKEAADSDRCIIIEGTVRACSRTENGIRYAADELVICERGQSTWRAGSENEAETAQRMLQTVDKTSSADNTLPKSHAISFTLTQERHRQKSVTAFACREKCSCSNRHATLGSLMPVPIITEKM